MTYEYDPELAFVVENEIGEIRARFAREDSAQGWRHQNWPYRGKVIDTTPKPRIPADAEYIMWTDGHTGIYMASRTTHNPNKPWDWESTFYSEEALLDIIAGAEITVLIPKED